MNDRIIGPNNLETRSTNPHKEFGIVRAGQFELLIEGRNLIKHFSPYEDIVGRAFVHRMAGFKGWPYKEFAFENPFGNIRGEIGKDRAGHGDDADHEHGAKLPVIFWMHGGGNFDGYLAVCKR